MSSAYIITTEKGEFSLIPEELIDVGISISLPDFLKDISEEDISKIFPATEQPIILRSCTERNVSFLINASDVPKSDSGNEEEFVLGLFRGQHNFISRLTPGYVEHGVRSKTIDCHTIACLEYSSNTIDDTLYNIFFLTVHNDKMIFGTFSCLAKDLLEMNIVFLACLSTLSFC